MTGKSSRKARLNQGREPFQLPGVPRGQIRRFRKARDARQQRLALSRSEFTDLSSRPGETQLSVQSSIEARGGQRALNPGQWDQHKKGGPTSRLTLRSRRTAPPEACSNHPMPSARLSSSTTIPAKALLFGNPEARLLATRHSRECPPFAVLSRHSRSSDTGGPVPNAPSWAKLVDLRGSVERIPQALPTGTTLAAIRLRCHMQAQDNRSQLHRWQPGGCFGGVIPINFTAHDCGSVLRWGSRGIDALR